MTPTSNEVWLGVERRRAGASARCGARRRERRERRVSPPASARLAALRRALLACAALLQLSSSGVVRPAAAAAPQVAISIYKDAADESPTWDRNLVLNEATKPFDKYYVVLPSQPTDFVFVSLVRPECFLSQLN